MDIQLVSQRLEALGNETRLEVYRVLVRAGPQGLPVGAVLERTSVARSTLSHHLRKLMAVDLVHQIREGTTLYCHANFSAMNDTLNFLSEQCCADSDTEPVRPPAHANQCDDPADTEPSLVKESAEND